MNAFFQNIFRSSKNDGSPPVTPTERSFYHDTIAISDGTANLFVLAPQGYDNVIPDGGWPLVIFTSGDGTSGNNTATNTGESMSTSDNLTYTRTPDLFGFRMMVSTVVINVNGTPTAWGKIGGTITGTGVSGTVTNFDHDDPSTNSSPTISVTFDSSQSGNTITCDYVRTSELIEGAPRWVNFGDTLDDRCVFIAIQNVQSTSDFDLDYFDDVVKYAWNNFTINPNRISLAGISRGGRHIIDSPGALPNRYQCWIDESTGDVYTSSAVGRVESGIASLVCGTASYGGSHTASNYTDIGMAFVHGTGDGVLTNQTYSMASQFASNNEPPYVLNINGIGHTRVAWDEYCYKRQYRVGGSTGSMADAPWDYLDFLLKYSRDDEERATLFVEQVEKRRYNTEKDIIDYRHAARQVAALGSGSVKTSLEGRLSTIKSAIDSTGTRWVINFHSSGLDESGGYTNFTGTTDGSLVSNITDFDGNSSSVDIELNTGTGAGMTAIASTRRSHTGGFSKTANASGLETTSWPIGNILFTDLPSGTYTIRIYHNRGDASYASNPNFQATINSVNKTQYSNINTLIGYVEYTGLSETEVADIDFAKIAGNNPMLTILELYKHP